MGSDISLQASYIDSSWLFTSAPSDKFCDFYILLTVHPNTVIPRLTKTILSGITFVSRNMFISAPGMARPFMFAALF